MARSKKRPIDHGNEDDVRSEKKRIKSQVDYDAEMLKILMKSVPGRHFMWRLLSECSVLQSGMRSDPHHMAFACGEREVGIKFMSEVLTYCPNEYSIMQREATIGPEIGQED